MESKVLTGYPSIDKPWEKYEGTVYAALEEKSKNYLDVPAIEYFSNCMRYRDLLEEIATYAKAFRSLGVGMGSVVTLCMPSIPEFIIAFYALNCIGAIANCVSFAFLKHDLKRYTDDKASSVLLILDQFYDAVSDQIELTRLKHVVITHLYDYMPEALQARMKSVDMPRMRTGDRPGMVCLEMSTFIKQGESQSTAPLPALFDENRDTTYLYTSGTTGEPKCAVFRDQAINALIQMHEGLPIHDAVGDRSLLIIPPYYATSLFYEVNLQLCRGLTLVLQPRYDKYTFAANLRDMRINRTLAAMSHYAALFGSDLQKGDLKNLKIPGCGGEAVSVGLANAINEKLAYWGAQDTLIIGGGQTENGSCVFEGYTVKNRVNETGNPLPGVQVRLVDPETNKEVDFGDPGELLISSPAAMDHYYNDPEATNEYFSFDQDGIRWGRPKDIAIRNKDGVYTMKGRKDDSFIDNRNSRIYLFNTEELASEDPAILECEAVALPMGDGKAAAQVLHIVLRPDCQEKQTQIIRRLCARTAVQGVKIRASFGTSEVTGKRDTKSLLDERTGFLSIFNGQVVQADFTGKDGIVYSPMDYQTLEQEGPT